MPTIHTRADRAGRLTFVALDPFGHAPVPDGVRPMSLAAVHDAVRDGRAVYQVADERGFWGEALAPDDFFEAARRTGVP